MMVEIDLVAETGAEHSCKVGTKVCSLKLLKIEKFYEFKYTFSSFTAVIVIST